jgi:hypothetical protein
MSGRAGQIAAGIQSGDIRSTLAQQPVNIRATVSTIIKNGFTAGLNYILLVAALIALTAGIVSLLTIRSKDFAEQRP